jgi:SWI/SNF-related matrix-associated actin-dependent regulator of chromatin subfamily A member 5
LSFSSPDHERIIAAVEKGESKLQRQSDIQDQLSAVIHRYRVPLQQLKITYNQTKTKNYTEEEDRFLIVMLERLGYGTDDVYDRIRDEIRKSPLFRFDWFLKSRTPLELQRRCAYLIKCLISDDKADEPVKAMVSFLYMCCLTLISFWIDLLMHKKFWLYRKRRIHL